MKQRNFTKSLETKAFPKKLNFEEVKYNNRDFIRFFICDFTLTKDDDIIKPLEVELTIIEKGNFNDFFTQQKRNKFRLKLTAKQLTKNSN